MITIPAAREFTPYNSDPTTGIDSVSNGEAPNVGGLRSGGGHYHGHNHGHNHNHNHNHNHGHYQGHGNGNGNGSSTNGAPNPTVVKPQRKPGQEVDGDGWPLNASKQRVDVDGHAIDKQGRRINEKNQLINDKNQTINEKGKWINDKGQTLNTLGKPVDDKGRLIDSQNRLINSDGRLVDERKRLIDKDGNRVNKEGYLIDSVGRPLDKNGKVAKSNSEKVMGNNEPHPQLEGMTDSLKKPSDNTSNATSSAPAAPSIDESTKKASKTSELVKKGWIPSAPEVSKTFILGMVDGFGGALAALPINVAESAASESIREKYLPKPLNTSTEAPAPSTSDGSVAPESEADKAKREEQAVQNTAINNLQVSVFETQSALDKLANGMTPLELVPGTVWPEDPVGRLDRLEELLDHLEPKAKEISDNRKVYYEIPELPDSIDGIDARIEALKGRLYAIAEFRERVEEAITKKATQSAGA